VTDFEYGMVMAIINRTKFADETLLNGAPVFLKDHFKSKRLCIFRAIVPMTLSGSQITPKFLASFDFQNMLWDGTFVDVIPESNYPRPNTHTVRFKIPCANWIILTANVEISDLGSRECVEIGKTLGKHCNYIKGFLCEKTGKDTNKNMPIFK